MFKELVERIFGKEEFQLVESKSLPKDAEPVNIKGTNLETAVKYDWLEKLYRRDPDVFAAVNHRVKTFMACKYTIVCEDEKVKRWFETFLENCSFDIILKKTALHQCVYGNVWVELIRDNKGKIVALDHIDPKIMDFGRDPNGNILWDHRNNPQYYVQILPYGAKVPPAIEPRLVQHINPIRDIQGMGIRFELEEIAHLPLYTIGDSIEGIGIIEPMYNSLLAKMDMEKNWAIAVKKAIAPLVIAKAGDEMHRPTPKAIEDLANEFQMMNSKSVVALPYYTSVDTLSVQIPSIEHTLDYYVDKIPAASGVPKPYITGSGDKTPRSTFKGLNLGYERDIMEMHRSISYAYEKQVFKVICKEQKFKTVPHLEFESPSLEYVDAQADRIVNYVNSGVILPDKNFRQLVRKKENLPPEPENIEIQQKPIKREEPMEDVENG